MIEILASGDKRRKKLDGIRERIAAAEQKLDGIDHAPKTVDEGVASILAQMDEPMGRLRLSLAQRLQSGPWGDLVPGSVDALTVYRFLVGDEQFVAYLHDRLTEQQPNPSVALPAAERHARRIEIRREIDELLDDEAAELAALEAQGFYCDSRSPEAAEDVDRFLAAIENAAST